MKGLDVNWTVVGVAGLSALAFGYLVMFQFAWDRALIGLVGPVLVATGYATFANAESVERRLVKWHVKAPESKVIAVAHGAAFSAVGILLFFGALGDAPMFNLLFGAMGFVFLAFSFWVFSNVDNILEKTEEQWGLFTHPASLGLILVVLGIMSLLAAAGVIDLSE